MGLWSDDIKDMVNSFISIGMGQSHPMGSDVYPSTTNIVYYKSIGGVHNLVSWADTMNYGLPLLYQTSFPAEYPQRNSHVEWVHPPVTDLCAGSDEGKDHHRLLIIFVALFSVSAIGNMIVLLWVYLKVRANKDRETNTLL